jgi:hypothetical protein
MLTRSEWQRACRLARNGGSLKATLSNLRAAYMIVAERYPHAAIQALALE